MNSYNVLEIGLLHRFLYDSRPLKSRLKYLDNCWMKCYGNLYRDTWYPEDES